MGRRTTISDIAARLNVSLHTVNKALSGKKGVSEATRQKVLDTAKAMDYQVNRVAQSMARKPVLIGILGSTAWREVFNDFRKGIDSALTRLRDYNVSGRYYQVTHLNCPEETDEVLKQIARDKIDVLICNHLPLTEKQADFLESRGIPFAFLGTDLLENRRLACVRSDAPMAGRLASELLAMMLPQGAVTAVMTGRRNYRDNEDKVSSFLSEADLLGLKVAGVYEHLDKPELVAGLLDKALAENPSIAGIYATTANSPALCKRIVELGLQGKISVVATDLHAEIRAYLRAGIVKAALYQDCEKEGERIVELLYGHLSEGKDISTPVLVPPVIALRNNMEMF